MTNNSESQELINAEIDGRLSIRGRQRLNELLESDDALRVEHEQLISLSEILENDRAGEPPSELRRSIMRDVRSSVAAGRFGAGTPRLSASRARYAYAFAAGLLIGVVGLSWYAGILTGPPVTSHEIAGSMSPRSQQVLPSPIDRVEFSAAGVHGTASLARHGANYTLTLDLRADEPVRAALVFDQEKVTLAGYAAEEGLENLRLDGSGLSWHMTGPLSLTIQVEPRSMEDSEIEIGFEGPGAFVRVAKIVFPDGKIVRL